MRAIQAIAVTLASVTVVLCGACPEQPAGGSNDATSDALLQADSSDVADVDGATPVSDAADGEDVDVATGEDVDVATGEDVDVATGEDADTAASEDADVATDGAVLEEVDAPTDTEVLDAVNDVGDVTTGADADAEAWDAELEVDGGAGPDAEVDVYVEVDVEPPPTCIDDDGDDYGMGPACLGPDCDDDDATMHPGHPELCDGVDNDCDPASADGSEDPLLGQDCDGDDSDLCEEGTWSCGATGLECSDVSDDDLDLCDGADNDCNPDTPDGADDPLVGASCDGDDSDACLDDSTVCVDGIPVCGDLSDDSVEVCNALDDDCDGVVNQPWAGPTETFEDASACESDITTCVAHGLELNPNVEFGSGACSFPDPFFGFPLNLVPGTHTVQGEFHAPDDLFDVYSFETLFESDAIDLSAFLLAAGQMPAFCFIGSVGFESSDAITVTVWAAGGPYVASGTSGAVTFALDVFDLFGVDYLVSVEPASEWTSCDWEYTLNLTIP